MAKQKKYTLVAKRQIETIDPDTGERKTIRAGGRFRTTDRKEAEELVRKRAAAWPEVPASEDGIGDVGDDHADDDADSDEDSDTDDEEDSDDGLGGTDNAPKVKKSAAKKAGKKKQK